MDIVSGLLIHQFKKASSRVLILNITVTLQIELVGKIDPLILQYAGTKSNTIIKTFKNVLKQFLPNNIKTRVTPKQKQKINTNTFQACL